MEVIEYNTDGGSGDGDDDDRMMRTEEQITSFALLLARDCSKCFHDILSHLILITTM